ncbi:MULTISPECIES: YceI family protein [unclassified Mesorhizobium]|uniref:YceI family protein n=1 Tax=unclassified Mesorhizobium TaxID=325217 RepID=UPI000FC9A635|nr:MULTISPECIES: YceI family protein [unclassified Mesorhizobium]RUW31534.1 polyisoprenoid-binding protein [Mesorhizobium sp. M1E.F.Ca.ET.041.01.1.1]RWD84774.1 MAG: polyisoprenoid-binding protein [Mesorhizobium sp.]RWD91612.1 MAG: polyisoprenoid-binding protein [Mesorhizobium sp.]TIV49895.1 MAG: polyisoprenoid-binding protein [Mesorhizobium sp.]TKB16933.1 MAG: polyisoprenoid-binding protein [Mesorhizobium sp.]
MTARILGLAAFAACLAMPVYAAVALSDAAGSYTISPSGSSIHFTIGKAGGGGFDGAFGRFKGTIRIDNSDVGRSKVDLTIYPESVGTGQGRIDAFLRSDAVFDSANNPEIQFRSTNVTRTGDTTALVTGRLTARGKTFSEKFTAELDGLKSGTIKFHVTGKVLRSRYGMDVGTPLYSNVVDFNMTLMGRRG